MIGSHNSFTFLPATKWYLRPFSFIWRCQDKNIKEQKALGVEFLDVRIRIISKVKNNSIITTYTLCHGLVDLGNVKFIDLIQLINFIESFDCKYRLIIEEDKFYAPIEYIKAYIKTHATNCIYFGLKKPWTCYFFKEDIQYVDYSYVPIYTGEKPEGAKFVLNTIKKWARKHNPIITKELIKDDKIHFMDYIGINNKN